MKPLSNPWWWLDWAAGLVAMSWVGVEGFIAYAKARQRLQLGLCAPIACNRYLLWGIVGIAWVVYSWVFLYQAIQFETNQVWSISIDRANGAVDALGVALIWLVFFPPRIYQRWIGGAALHPKVAES